MKTNNIQIFNSTEFGEIRVIGTPDNPLFCLVDVCKALELQRKHVIERLDKDAVSNGTLPTNGGNQTFTFINEDGLYDVIFDSRKPEAKKFRKWVTSEVLPSIRKHGAYMTDETLRKVSQDLRAMKRLVCDLRSDNRRIREEQERWEGRWAEMVMTEAEQDTITQRIKNNQQRIPSYTTEQLEQELGWDRNISLATALIQFSLLLPTADGTGRINPKYERMGLYFHDFLPLLQKPTAQAEPTRRPTILWTDRGRAVVHLVAQHYDSLQRDIRDTVRQFDDCVTTHLTRFQRTYTTLIS